MGYLWDIFIHPNVNHKPSIWEWDEWLRAPIKMDIYGALRGWFTVVKKPHGYGKDATVGC